MLSLENTQHEGTCNIMAQILLHEIRTVYFELKSITKILAQQLIKIVENVIADCNMFDNQA